MNWKNVLYLLRVERKSGRLLRGIKATRYKENTFLSYWPYWTAAIIGVAIGLLANYITVMVYSEGTPEGLPPISVGAISIFAVLPTLVLVVSIIFTMLQQIQLAGIKASSQVMYWLPITWQEHTLASILANLLGWPAAIVTGLSFGVIVFSAFNGLIFQALLTVAITGAAAFMASSITECLGIIQVRLTGAIYKSSGRGAIWVRLVGTLLFFIVFYIFYLYVTQGFMSFVASLTAAQNSGWYIPFIWLALLLSYALNGLFAQAGIFLALSLALILGFYYLAVALNMRFGLYEPPAITVQKSGVYAPKVGFLDKIGFSTVEAALIRKDLRAFTRRRELIGVYIAPIIMIIIPIMNSLGVINSSSGASEATFILTALIFFFPAGLMAMLLGEVLIGEEGPAVWRIYASPITPKNLVKSKFFFVTLFSTIILLVSGTIGFLFYRPSIELTITSFIECFFVVLAVGAISLAVGFKGADFSVTKRQRMIRQEWALIGLLVGGIAAGGVLAPVLVTYLLLPFLTGQAVNAINLAISIGISGVISAVLTAVFYRVNLGLADDLLKKAQI